MQEKTCCFTGHRRIPIDDHEFIQKRLESEVLSLIHQGVHDFMAGGALGFDTLAAQTVLSLKDGYPQIKLILVLPCKEQTKGWGDRDVNMYNFILQQADKVIYTSEHYSRGCMHVRNRYLVDNSGFCVCYLTSENGGTAYTVRYAGQKGLRIVNLAFE